MHINREKLEKTWNPKSKYCLEIKRRVKTQENKDVGQIYDHQVLAKATQLYISKISREQSLIIVMDETKL